METIKDVKSTLSIAKGLLKVFKAEKSKKNSRYSDESLKMILKTTDCKDINQLIKRQEAKIKSVSELLELTKIARKRVKK